MPTYRTAGAWGPGKGSNLTPAEVDTNFYELRTDLDDVIANPPTANSIETIVASGFFWTVTLTDGTVLDPLAIPVVQMVWRGEWQPLTLYSALDKFFVEGVGEFTVMVDHTSAATFDANAVGGSPPAALYLQTSGVGSNTTLDNLADVSITGVADDDILVYDAGSPTGWRNRTPADVLASLAVSLDDLTDVIAPAPSAGQVLRYLGGSPDALWQPDTLMLDDLGDVDAGTPTLGQVLTWTGSPASWQPATPAAIPTTLDALTDVAVPSPTDGDFLQYQAGSPASWVNAAGSAISGLGDATLPLVGTAYMEVSEPAGSPATYTSKRIEIDDLFTDRTLAGTTLFPGGTQISSIGELGIGGSPTGNGLFCVFGTYITAGQSLAQLTATHNSSVTGTQIGFNLSPSFSPSGASLTTIQAIGASPTVSGSSLNISVLQGIAVVPRLTAGYTGTISSSRGLQVNDVSITGTGLVTDSNEFYAAAMTHGNGLASGTNTNRQFYALGITASAAGGTLNNRAIEVVVPSGGASSGTANNRGIYITGNGGVPSGSPPGTVNNFAIISESTAYSRVEGGLGVGLVTRNATTATSPYFYIPTCAGTPTGVPRNAAVGATAMIFDDTAHKLWIYEQSTATWKGVVVA